MNFVQYVYERNGVLRSDDGHMREMSRAKSCHIFLLVLIFADRVKNQILRTEIVDVRCSTVPGSLIIAVRVSAVYRNRI